MPNWNDWEENRKKTVDFVLKVLHDGGIILIAAALLYHAGHGLRALFAAPPPPVQADPIMPQSFEPPVLRGSVRTVAGVPVRRAFIHLQPGDGRSKVSIEANEAGYFECACPMPGAYRMHVQIGEERTPQQPIELSDCGAQLLEIRVRQQPGAGSVVARAGGR